MPVFSSYLNAAAQGWFWMTMVTTFYLGLWDVLPSVYGQFSYTWLLLHQVFCCFVWVQMAVNWACVKCTNSHFLPENHMDYIAANADYVSNGGYEINLNHLKQSGNPGSYSLPVQSLRSLDKSAANTKKLNFSTLYVVTNEQQVGSKEDKRSVVYPYWSWKPCVICQVQRPPRTHHCNICNTCIMKRDHHCYFTGTCIGLWNQRHFVVFSFWSSVITVYSILHGCIYLYSDMMTRISFADLLLPITVVRWSTGGVNPRDTAMVALGYSMAWFCLTSVGLLFDQVRVVRRGITSFEREGSIKVVSASSISDNISGVFGRLWWLNFLLPLHWVFPGLDDGVSWPNIKM